MEIIRDIWGKKKGDIHYPLLFHMLDTASVALMMLKHVLKKGFLKWFTNELGFPDAEQTTRLLSFWAGLHDIGKAFPGFQEQRESLEKVSHSLITARTLKDIFINELGYNTHLAKQISTILGGHHGVFPQSEKLNLSSSKLGGLRWHNIRIEAVKKFYSIVNPPFPKNIEHISNAIAMIFAGLVSVSDWIASNEEFFPLTESENNIPENHYTYSLKKAKESLDKIYWTSWDNPTEKKNIEDLFPIINKFGPNKIQQHAVKIAQYLNEPSLVIIEAPMGEGKTEAAMYLADTWAVNLSQRGYYFALPTQATSNQMFGRVKSYLQERYPHEAVNLMLIHGHAALSSEFQTLRKNEVILNSFNLINDDEKGSDSKNNIIAAEWFTSRKRGLLAPFGVGTVDQILLSVLQTRHFFVRLFGLAYKTIIVDEVHAYDAYMITLLERLLEWFGALQCSVILLSATLPKTRTAALISSYAKGAGIKHTEEYENKLEMQQYPRITLVNTERFNSEYVNINIPKTLNVKWIDGRLPKKESESFPLGEQLQLALEKGGCAAVICSTVDRAQKMYLSLKRYFSETDSGDGYLALDLLHARYLYKDRDEREKKTFLRFGPPDGDVDYGKDGIKKVKRPKLAVLVSTQIIEQSLDLDFDLIITDMAPVDLILQRAGRMHRHKQHLRPENLSKPNLWICHPEEIIDQTPKFDSGTEAVYGNDSFYILYRSWLALKNVHNIVIPDDVDMLIEKVYGAQQIPRNDTNLLEIYERFEHKQNVYRTQAYYNSILPPFYEDEIFEDFNKQLQEDNPEINTALQALTRPQEQPTISVICLYGNYEETFLDPEHSQKIDLRLKPTIVDIVSLLRNSVRITGRYLINCILDNTQTPSPWKDSSLLRHYRLLLFDQECISRLENYELRIDKELGLIKRRNK